MYKKLNTMLFFLPGGDDTERKAFIFPLLVTSFLREKLFIVFKSSIVSDFGKKESNMEIWKESKLHYKVAYNKIAYCILDD